jgi:hypothetical protein
MSAKMKEIVNRFVSEVMEIAQEEAASSLREKITEEFRNAIADGSIPFKRKKTKRASILRQCPIAGCEAVAAPRWGMVCKEHRDSCSRDQILEARANATKEGGIWHKPNPAKKAS